MKIASSKRKSRAKNKKYKELQAAHMQKELDKKIEKGNKGYEIFVKMGYEAGKDGKEIRQPLPLEVKNECKGNRATTSADKVVSAKVNAQSSSGKPSQSKENKANKVDRKDVEVKKTASSTIPAKVNKLSSSEKQSQPKENEVTKDNRKDIQATNSAKVNLSKKQSQTNENNATKNDLKEATKSATSTLSAKVNKQASLSEKQSQPKGNKATKDDCKGIQATKLSTSTVPAKVFEPSPRSKRRSRWKANKIAREAAELQARIAKEQEIQKATDKAKELLIKANEAAELLKPINNTGIKSADSNAKTSTHSPRRALSPEPGLKSKTSKLSEQKILQDPQFDNAFLKSLLKRFYSEIQLLQLHLEANATADHEREDDLILAKICKLYNKIINDHDLEFLRSELIGWIGRYQEEYMDTPIFHDMTNNEQHITVVCDNEYAYKCLEHCIADIQNNRSNNICILRVPPTTPLIYCFEVIYDGLTHDPDVFLFQLQLHKPKLRTECWIVASYEASTYKRRTTMILLTDERSAMALTFLYTSNFYVCMQSVSFRNLGIVAEDYLFDLNVGI